jgi:hypothetical protein
MSKKEIRAVLLPFIDKVEAKYKPQDVATALLTVAFEILLKADPDANRTHNVFRALADNAARSRMQPKKA